MAMHTSNSLERHTREIQLFVASIMNEAIFLREYTWRIVQTKYSGDMSYLLFFIFPSPHVHPVRTPAPKRTRILRQRSYECLYYSFFLGSNLAILNLKEQRSIQNLKSLSSDIWIENYWINAIASNKALRNFKRQMHLEVNISVLSKTSFIRAPCSA